jgi:hypothetical protein
VPIRIWAGASKTREGMKQGFEGTCRHANGGEHAGDPLSLPDRGLEGDVDAGRRDACSSGGSGRSEKDVHGVDAGVGPR